MDQFISSLCNWHSIVAHGPTFADPSLSAVALGFLTINTLNRMLKTVLVCLGLLFSEFVRWVMSLAHPAWLMRFLVTGL